MIASIFMQIYFKVSKFQNELMKFLPKYEPIIVRISVQYCATVQGRNPYNIWFKIWKKRWNLLTFITYLNIFIVYKSQIRIRHVHIFKNTYTLDSCTSFLKISINSYNAILLVLFKKCPESACEKKIWMLHRKLFQLIPK